MSFYRPSRATFQLALLISLILHGALLLFARAPDLKEKVKEKEVIKVKVSMVTPEPEKKPAPKLKKKVVLFEADEAKMSDQPVAAEPKRWEVPQQQRRMVRATPQRQLRPSHIDLSLPPEPRKPDTIPPLWQSESWEPAGIGIENAGGYDPIGNRIPDYPLEMRHKGKPGMVQLGILVDTLGNVEDVIPLEVRGSMQFAKVAVGSVMGWEGLPVMRDSSGTKVWYWVRKKFYFNTQAGDPIHNFKAMRKNLHEQVPEDKDYGKMLYEHIYNYK